MSKEQATTSLSPTMMILGSPVFAEHGQSVIKQANHTFGNRPQTHINQGCGKRVGNADTPPSSLSLEFRVIASGSVEVLRFYVNILAETVNVTCGAECYMLGGTGAVKFTVGSTSTTLSFDHSAGDSGVEKTATLATSATGSGWQLCTVEIEKLTGTYDINLSRFRIQDQTITSGLPGPSIEGDSETMDVKEEGTAVVLSARALNFIGADITAASAGSGIANVTVTGGGVTLPVTDTTGIAKGSVDATKIVRLECDTYVSTATTRVITVPDQDVDLRPTDGTYQAPVGDLDSSASVTGSTDYVAVDISGTGHRKVLLDDLGIGGGAKSVSAKTADFSAEVDFVYIVDSSSADVTVTLPALGAGNSGSTINILHKVIGNSVIINPEDPDTEVISGGTAVTLAGVTYQNVTLMSTGTLLEWVIL